MAENIAPRRLRAGVLLIEVALLLALSMTACSLTPPSAGTATPTAVPAFVATLRPRLEAQMKHLGVPGAIFLVQAPGKGVWTAALGISDVAANAPMTLDEHMRVGSITKTFTGTVILQLVDEGRLKLDDPAAKYQPQTPNGAHITIRELLNMTSGLFNYTEDDGFDKALLAQPARVWQPSELLAIAFQHPAYFAPGAGFHYSNTNTILLGLIAEQITGEPLAQAVQQRILAPLGMRSTSLPQATSAAIPVPHPQGYASTASGECPAAHDALPAGPRGLPNGLCNVTSVNPSWAWAAGSAISTLSDLRVWAKALATGALLHPATQKQRLTWSQMGTVGSYGLAIFDVQGFLGHNGALPGFQSFMGYRPGQAAMVIVLTNLDQATTCTPASNPGEPPTCSQTADALTQTIIKTVFA